MTTQSDLAILGLRLGILGSSAALAIAAPIANGNPSDTAATAATRIGVYFDRTGAAEKLGVVVMGTELLSIGVTAVTSTVPMRITDTTNASSTVTGSFSTLGGLSYGVTKSLYGGAAVFGGDVLISQAVSGGAAASSLAIVTPAHLALQAGVEYSTISLGTSAIQQFNTGAITSNRFIKVTAPTYGFVGATVVGTAATFAIVGAPIPGVNATFTNAYAFWVQAGLSAFAGAILGTDGTVTNPGIAFLSLPGTGLYRTASPEAFHVAVANSEYLRLSAPSATETALWVYDFDNATVERVTVGAADSGGSGFKLLRIPN